MINIIQAWMKKLGYPASSHLWVWLYYSTILEHEKGITADAFRIPGSKNLECTILMATDTNGMRIDNLDILFIIQ